MSSAVLQSVRQHTRAGATRYVPSVCFTRTNNWWDLRRRRLASGRRAHSTSGCEKAHGRRIYASQANIANTTSSEQRARAEVSDGVVPIKKELSKKEDFFAYRSCSATQQRQKTRNTARQENHFNNATFHTFRISNREKQKRRCSTTASSVTQHFLKKRRKGYQDVISR